MNDSQNQVFVDQTDCGVPAQQGILNETAQSPRLSRSSTHWQDYAGVAASVACAVHCAAMPLVIGFLPAFGLSFLSQPSFHQWMAGVCGIVALAAFLPGWRMHRNWRPAVIAVLGLVLITGTAFGLSDKCCEVSSAASPQAAAITVPSLGVDACLDQCCQKKSDSEPTSDPSEKPLAVVSASAIGAFASRHAAWWTPLGGLFLVAGHLLNRHYVCRCGCCS